MRQTTQTSKQSARQKKRPPQRKRRYSKRQIFFNRLLVLVVFAALLFGVFKGAKWTLNKLNIIDSPSVFEAEVAVEKKTAGEPVQEPVVQEEESVQAQEIPAEDEQYQGIDIAKAMGEENTDDPYYEAELPMLTNPDNPIPSDFQPNLVEIYGGYKFDAHAVAEIGRAHV